jgi:hypothetical protein
LNSIFDKDPPRLHGAQPTTTAQTADQIAPQPRETFDLLFVYGPARSGTTLLASLLARGDAYPLLPECTIITAALAHRLTYLSVAADQHRYKSYAIDDDTLDGYYRTLIDRFIDNAAASFPRANKHLILKDPELCLIAEHVHRFISRPVKSVCIVRDPRDVIASMYEVRRRAGENAPDLGQIMMYIKSQYDGLIRALDVPHSANPTFLVRYEDLVNRDPDTIRRLEEFCGYALDIEDYEGVPTEALVTDSPFFKTTLLGPVLSERVGSHAAVLDAGQLQKVEDLFASVLARFDYEPSVTSRPISNLERMVEYLGAELTESHHALEQVRLELHVSRVAHNEIAADLASSRSLLEAAMADRAEADITAEQLRLEIHALRGAVRDLTVGSEGLRTHGEAEVDQHVEQPSGEQPPVGA